MTSTQPAAELQKRLAQALASKRPVQLAALAASLHLSGQSEAALAAYERLAIEAPGEIKNWHIIAALRLQLNLPRAALAACNKALEIDAKNPDTVFNTGVVLATLGDPAAALHCYDKVLELDPRHPGALRNRPTALTILGRVEEGLEAAQRAVLTYPADPWLYNNLGEFLLGQHRASEAVDAFRQALALKPDLHWARYALSVALSVEGKVADAYEERAKALAGDPELASRYRSPLVLDAMQGGSDLSPERVALLARMAMFRLGDWRLYDDTISLYTKLVRGEENNPPLDFAEMPFLALGLPVGEDIRRQVARQASARIAASVAGIHLFRPTSRDGERIKIGYLSADFRDHPISWVTAGMYAAHDRNRFEIFAYATDRAIESDIRRRIAADVDVFREVGHFSATTIAQIVASDGIDILVDLSGYTLYAKPEVLALRPAPVQVAYLGFIGTYGAPYLDYAMQDHTVLTPHLRQFRDEKIAYLPGSAYFCDLPSTVKPTSRAGESLPQDAFVMYAMHSPRKLDPRSFNVWLELLREIPRSILWLQEEQPQQVKNLRRLAGESGIDPDRLVFSFACPYEDYLGRLRLADVFLDPFEFNGHGTMIDALSSGVPAVTLCGDTVVSRVAACMLQTHGLPELVARDEADYKRLVRRLADDPVWRAEIAARVRDYENSDLFCPQRKLREIETAYEMMWKRHLAGLPPEDFDVPPMTV